MTPDLLRQYLVDLSERLNAGGVHCCFRAMVGAYGEADCIRIAQSWICAYAVPDHVLGWLYAVQAPLFGKI